MLGVLVGSEPGAAGARAVVTVGAPGQSLGFAGVEVGVVDDPVDGAVVVVAGSDAAAVVVVVGSAAAVVDDGLAVEEATVVSVVPVVSVFWALTGCSGRTVRAAMAPPVVTAVPRAATKALFLMTPRLGPDGQIGLGPSSDSAPNSYGKRRAGCGSAVDASRNLSKPKIRGLERGHMTRVREFGEVFRVRWSGSVVGSAGGSVVLGDFPGSPERSRRDAVDHRAS